MPGDMPPAAVLAAAGLNRGVIEPVRGHPRVWLAATAYGRVVIRRCAGGGHSAWLRDVLGVLSPLFPVPGPIPLFGGHCSFEDTTGWWEAVSFLPGRVVGFGDEPSLYDVGAFLASFHRVSLDSTGDVDPRPGGARLQGLAQDVDWTRAAKTMGSTEAVHRLRRLLDRFATDMVRLDYSTLARCVVHGDPTTFNVLASGHPARPSGLIDLELADVEAPVADIAFSLWRSGRKEQGMRELDCGRVANLVAGYHSARPLADVELAAIPACLRGRGLQMLVKRTRLGMADDGPLEQLLWIESHQNELADGIAKAIAGGWYHS